MGRKRKIPTPTGSVDAEVVGFRSQSEEFNQYLLDDGTVLKLKVVATEILRLEDQYDAQGNPAYLVQSQNIVTVDAPDSLRRDPQ